MRLTLIFCSLLLGLILASSDGRLKYAEGLSGNAAFDGLLLSPVPAAGDIVLAQQQQLQQFHHHYSQQQRQEEVSPAVDAVTNAKRGREDTKEEEDKVEEEQEKAEGEPGEMAALNCFPVADLRHKYDWPRYHLHHLVDTRESPGKRTESMQGKSVGGGVDRQDSSGAKRSDYNRDISTDLYVQYPTSCACQTKYELLDLGYTHFPRYIVNAICQNRSANSRKCWRGSSCKEIPYKVRVLTRRTESESSEQDHHSTLLPEPLRDYWRFKTVTIAAACQCSI